MEPQLKDHEKFWAFVLLITSIVTLAAFSIFFGSELQDASTRILDSAVAGLIGIAGMSAQALFRFSATEQSLVETVRSQAESIPAAVPEPIPVRVENTDAQPVPVETTSDGELKPDEKLP